jgi:hypothetical protein
MKMIISAILLGLMVPLATISSAVADDKGTANEKTKTAKAHRDAAATAAKPEDRKKELNDAIKDWEAAYAAAKKFDLVGAEAIKEEKATEYRSLNEDNKAAGIEEETAKALEKIADGMKTTDPKRAQELLNKAAQKWTQAAADRNKAGKAADAANDTNKATAATKAANDLGAAATAATPTSGHP